MPSIKLYSEVNRLKAWVARLQRSVQLRDERIETLTAEGLGLQELLTVVGEQRDEAREERDLFNETVVSLSSVAQELAEARGKLVPYAVGPSGEPFFETKADAERALEQVEREYDGVVRAVRGMRLLCMNDPAYKSRSSQVFEAVQIADGLLRRKQ